MNISPNVNFNNPSFSLSYKQPFKNTFSQTHLSASSSDIGKTPTYKNVSTLIGGAAILSLNHWASKVCSTYSNPRGHGTFTTTTYKGKNGKMLTLICAYISVQKGSYIGENTLYNQQTMLMEQQAIKENKLWEKAKCPRKEANKALSEIIHTLQEQDHAILLALDANQTPKEYYKADTLKTDTIEWLRQEHGLIDPFMEMFQQRPQSTTIHQKRDIDYILTHNIPFNGITLLAPDTPATSDHYGICIDINIAKLFDSSYSDLAQISPRRLTVDNVKAKKEYETIATKQFSIYFFLERSIDLLNRATTSTFSDEDDKELNQLDEEITTTLLDSEVQCSNKKHDKNPWSPKLRKAGRRLSYWIKKIRMINKRHIHWGLLDKKRKGTDINDADHNNLELQYTKKQPGNGYPHENRPRESSQSYMPCGSIQTNIQKHPRDNGSSPRQESPH